MGQTLSEPSVEKFSDRNASKHLLYGLSAMQGWRISMEDAHISILDVIEKLQLAEEGASKHPTPLSLFGVFDGHGGDMVAKYAGKHIDSIITSQSAFKTLDYPQALKDGFLATDQAILADKSFTDDVSGCAACVGLIAGDTLYVANAGDSRSVLGVKGRAKLMSHDHKPNLSGEQARITAAGGFVEYGRVNGNLALSRALGDFVFKDRSDRPPECQVVTASPDIEVHTLSDNDEFLVLACDGIWDCQSSQSVVEFVRRGIAARQSLDRICENLMDNCLASHGDTGGVGSDNMTMIIVGFLNGRTEDEWYDEIARRVAEGDGPCAPPEYAVFRGPGVHANSNDLSYDSNGTAQEVMFSVPKGRVIHLGDGSEVATSLDLEMTDEKSDLQHQVPKSSPPNEREDDDDDDVKSDVTERSDSEKDDTCAVINFEASKTDKAANKTSVPSKDDSKSQESHGASKSE